MPTYTNGYIPLSLLTVFDRGYNDTDGNWYHALSPATLARHLALVNRGRKRTGRTLAINRGWSAYRPYAAQVLAKKIHGIYAATPGTSSHGGLWEGRQCLAMDYGNWASVYEGFGGIDSFAADCRSVGLSPLLIVKSRGYPDEFWHVIDLNPWSAVPAFDDAVPFPIPTEVEPDDMRIYDAARHGFALVGAGYFKSLTAAEGAALTKLIASNPVSDADFAAIRTACTAGDTNYLPPVRTPNVATDVWAHKVNGANDLHGAAMLTLIRDRVVAPQGSVDYDKIIAGIVAGVVAALPDGSTATAAEIADELAKRLQG